MRTFSIPYNHDKLLIDTLVNTFPEIKKSIGEIFFPIPVRFCGSGRVLTQSDEYDQEIIDLIKKSKMHGIKSNILINPGCFALNLIDTEFIKKIIDYLSFLHEECGLDAFTCGEYILSDKIKKTLPNLELECSSIAYVDSLEKAQYWAEIGCDIMVIPPDLNKNLNFIIELKEYLPDIRLKMITNQLCLPQCPMRQFHNNLEGHGDYGQIYLDICRDFFIQKPWIIYSSTFIPPQGLDYYDGYINIYKLIDRSMSTQEIVTNFGAYCGHVGFTEKTAELNAKIPNSTLEKIFSCNKACTICKWCEKKFNKTK